MKNKKYLIIVIVVVLVLLLVGGLLCFLNNKPSNNEEEKILENISYTLTNKQFFELADEADWVVVEKFGYDEYEDEFEITSSDNIVASLSEILAWQVMGGDRWRDFTEVYYRNNNIYTSKIVGNEIVINRVDLNSNTYDEYIKSPMPSDYECKSTSGTCLASIAYVDDNNIYFQVITYNM